MSTEYFPDQLAGDIRYYVYRLIDSRNGQTFHVGKGTGNPVFMHAQGVFYLLPLPPPPTSSGDDGWGGDISPKTMELVNIRLRQTMGDPFYHGYITARTHIPRQTDIDVPKNYRQNKHMLLWPAGGPATGARAAFPLSSTRLTMWCPSAGAARTTWTTSSSYAQAAIASRATAHKEYLVARLGEIGGVKNG